MSGICCVAFLLEKPPVKKYFFKSFPKKTAQIVNLKNPDLDLIRRIYPECGFMDWWSVFEFAQKTQVSVLGFVEIRICIFPPKTQGFVYHVCPGLLVEPIIRPLIRSGTWEITLNDKIMTSITSNVTNNKKEIWKTVRLTKHKFYSKTTISIRCCLLQVSRPCILLHFSSAIYTFFSCSEQIFLSLTQFCGGSHCFVNFMTQLPKPLVIAGMTHCFEMGLNL